MEQSDYLYEEQSRRPATLLALAAGAAMLFVGAAYGAPWYFLAPVVLGSLMSLWMIVVNRKSGAKLTGSELSLYGGSWNRTVSAAQIHSVKIVRWMDGAPSVTLQLTDGETLDIPGYCFGSADQLASALSCRGVQIV
jgi:hypothetical protein